MYKNQLQELAQRSCFNLPAYSCIREGPDHAPRFKAMVNFSGEVFESPNFCSTLRQAEHAAAEVALNILSKRGPSQAVSARMLDETGVCKNLLQETAQRAGASLPVYTTIRSGPGHIPVFKCIVEVAGLTFVGEPAKTKKQAEKNAAMTALSALKLVGDHDPKPVYGKDEAHSSEALMASRRRVRVTHVRDRSHKEGISISRFRLHSDGGGETFNRPLLMLPSSSSHESSSILSREASAANRAVAAAAAGSMIRTMPAVRIRSLPSSSRSEVRPPLEDHLKDEEEWLNGEQSKGSLQRREEVGSYTRMWPSQKRPQLEEHLKNEEELCHGEPSKGSLQREEMGSYINMWPSRRIRGLPSTRCDVKPPLEEHLKDEEEWLCGEPSKGSLQREETSPYTLRMWPAASSPNWGSHAMSANAAFTCAFPFHPATSLAPAVRIRQVATVCSAAPPPRVPNRTLQIGQDGPMNDQEADTLERLCQLRL